MINADNFLLYNEDDIIPNGMYLVILMIEAHESSYYSMIECWMGRWVLEERNEEADVLAYSMIRLPEKDVLRELEKE